MHSFWVKRNTTHATTCRARVGNGSFYFVCTISKSALELQCRSAVLIFYMPKATQGHSCKILFLLNTDSNKIHYPCCNFPLLMKTKLGHPVASYFLFLVWRKTKVEDLNASFSSLSFGAPVMYFIYKPHSVSTTYITIIKV